MAEKGHFFQCAMLEEEIKGFGDSPSLFVGYCHEFSNYIGKGQEVCIINLGGTMVDRYIKIGQIGPCYDTHCYLG
jgi:hypothetical protein